MLLVFMLGVFMGALALACLLWWWAGSDGSTLAAARAKHDLAEVERRTLQRLMAAELAARRAPHPAPAPAGSDIVEGTATDLDRPS
jgi:hypothetical protein